MPDSAVQRVLRLAEVAANRPLCRDHYCLTLSVSGFPGAEPGQFLQILCREPRDEGWTAGPMLRRPFSIGGLRQHGTRSEIDILHRALGRGTRWLASLQPGAPVSIIGPLGRPFSIAPAPAPTLLVAGGIGLPPLIWLAQVLRRVGREVLAFVGARTADQMPLTRIGHGASFREFEEVGARVVVATDDGSLGARGTISEVFAAHLARHAPAPSAVVYTCGPRLMMHRVAQECERYGLACQVCLEQVMACGMGTCQSCVVRIREPAADGGWVYRLCCTDGPVFDSRMVLWS